MPERDAVLNHVFACVAAALDKRASAPVVLKVAKLTSYTDYFLIVSASSDRRVQAVAEGVRDAMKERGVRALGAEGVREGRWALLDFGAFVVHVFFDEVRPIFDLEGLWADAERIDIPEEYLKAPPRGREAKG
jgi:ribosome-associated protein